MSRTPLVIGGVAVLAAAIVLVVLLSKSSDDTTPDSPTTASPASSASGDMVARPVLPPPVAPSREGRDGQSTSVTVTDSPRGETGDRDKAREYKVGDVPVRDHRSGSHDKIDLPPNIHPAEGRMLPSPLTHAISQQVRTAMMECASSLPREGRGAKPRLEGTIDVAIKNETLSVQKSTVQLRDLDNAGVDAVKQCVESRSIGLSAPAATEANLDSYTIRLSFAIP